MPTSSPDPAQGLFARGSWREVRRIGDILRTETVGGLLLLGAALVALIWANSPWSPAYQLLRSWQVGPAELHLDLTLAQWAADGLLAVFFFVAGLELKREFVAGDLRTVRRAILPVAGAVGGMAIPALIYVVINLRAADLGLGAGALEGWAIPTATDIAFALAVLAVISTHLPAALRTFLLALAVVDDLLAITIIAVFYTDTLQWQPLALACLPLGIFALLVHHRVRTWWLLLPVALLTWFLVHESGVHATVAGVALALTVPVRARLNHEPSEDPDSGRAGARDRGAGPDSRQSTRGLADRFEHRLRPISAGFAVPVFAFFAAGVPVTAGVDTALHDPVTIGIVAGLLVGKSVGVFAATWFVRRVTGASLAGMSWWDVLGLAFLGGIGFTVSLLIGELAFIPGSSQDTNARLGVLAGSLLSALVATIILRLRNRHYLRLCADEEVDNDHHGIPDIYESEPEPSGTR